MPRTASKQLYELNETEWFELSDLEGVTLINDNDSSSHEEREMNGWTCVTPVSKDKNGVTLWIKPDEWNKVKASYNNRQTKNVKEVSLNQYIRDVKEKLHVVDIVFPEKDKKSHAIIWFDKEWPINLMGVNLIQRTKFSVKIPRRNVERWANDYFHTKQLNVEEFTSVVDPESKWNTLLSEWEKQILPCWNAIVEPLNDAQRSVWYGWFKKAWSSVYWNEKEPVAFLKYSFNTFQNEYENKKHKQEKQAELVATEKMMNFEKFESHFIPARARQRVWTFFMGPPNTGKTYNSLKMLEEAKTGAYWGPLRLLALEGHEALLDRGIMNDLITGEERRYSFGSTHVASTIEMADLHKPVEVAVLDEVQLLSDPDRGWAWTQAMLGAPTNNLVLTGSSAAIPYLEKLVEYLGDKLEVVELKSDRKLKRDRAICDDWSRLKKGDCLIAFSRKDVLSWKEAAENRNWKVSVIYGHLSPEIRREEARKFREGETDILVSTDAIGLGLNLPIKRIIFTSVTKFDGTVERMLKPSEAWQIANRAGRKGWVEEGSVTTWSESDECELFLLLDSKDEPPKDLKWWVQPLPSQVELWNQKMGVKLSQLLSVFAEKMLRNHPIFKPCPMTEAIKRAEKIQKMDLHIVEQYAYATAPIDKDDLESENMLYEWAYKHSIGKKITWNEVKEHWLEKEFYHSRGEALLDAEKKLKMLTVYRWLTLRFPDVYLGREEAQLEHERLNSIIERALIDIVKKKEKSGNGAGKNKNKKSTFIR